MRVSLLLQSVGTKQMCLIRPRALQLCRELLSDDGFLSAFEVIHKQHLKVKMPVARLPLRVAQDRYSPWV